MAGHIDGDGEEAGDGQGGPPPVGHRSGHANWQGTVVEEGVPAGEGLVPSRGRPPAGDGVGVAGAIVAAMHELLLPELWWLAAVGAGPPWDRLRRPLRACGELRTRPTGAPGGVG